MLDHGALVLADYGNMPASTALFVLERLMQAGLPPCWLLTAMVPIFCHPRGMRWGRPEANRRAFRVAMVNSSTAARCFRRPTHRRLEG